MLNKDESERLNGQLGTLVHLRGLCLGMVSGKKRVVSKFLGLKFPRSPSKYGRNFCKSFWV
jgi:hypothetical protein